MGTFLDARLCVDATGVGAVINAQSVVVNQLARIFWQLLCGLLVDIAIERVPFFVGHPDVSCIDIGCETFEALCGVVAGEDLDGIDNPAVRNFDAALGNVVTATIIPVVVVILCKVGRGYIFRLKQY